jgi:acetyl esterase/lipase
MSFASINQILAAAVAGDVQPVPIMPGSFVMRLFRKIRPPGFPAQAVALLCAGFLHTGIAQSAEAVRKDISYLSDADAPDAYAQAQCRLDLYIPEKPSSGFPLLVWFHGGGLTAGARNPSGISQLFAAQGIAVANADYRLNPKVRYPVYLQDAAKAVACAIREAVKKGANPHGVFISGHSAGAYMAAMLAMDPHYLREAGVPEGAIAGCIPVSAQMTTHFTVRAERGISEEKIRVDEAAPLYHARKDAPPMLLLVADQDMPARLQENQLFVSVMNSLAKNEATSLLVVPDRTHGSICTKLMTEGDIGGAAILEFIKKWARPPEPAGIKK